MIKHRVSMALAFKLDKCGLCGGVWFDAGEWEAVCAQGLLPRLNFLFNDSTQHRLHEQLTRAQYEDRCRRIVGDDALAKVRDFKNWLNMHPGRDTLRAYLDDRELTE